MMVGEFNDNRVTTAKHSTHPMNSSYPSSAGGNRILTTTQPMYPQVYYQALKQSQQPTYIGGGGSRQQQHQQTSLYKTTASTKQQLNHTSSSFMPGSRPNKYLNMMKQNQTKSVKSMLKREGDKQTTTTTQQRNQTAALHRQVKRDEALGIGEEVEMGFEKEETSSNIELMQEEQREIETRLKFIDGLLNNQQWVSNAKFYGGGILRKPAQEEFVDNLDQYQRAVDELRTTMKNVEKSQKASGAFSYFQTNPQVQYFQGQEVVTLQEANLRQSRQVLNLKQQTSGGGGNVESREDTDKVSVSSHFTNEDGRLYDATLARQSLNTQKLKNSDGSSYVYRSIGNENRGSESSQLVLDTSHIPAILHEEVTNSSRSVQLFKNKSSTRSIIEQQHPSRQTVPHDSQKIPLQQRSQVLESRDYPQNSLVAPGVADHGSLIKFDVIFENIAALPQMSRTGTSFQSRVANRLKQFASNENNSSYSPSKQQAEQALLGIDGQMNPNSTSKQILQRRLDLKNPPLIMPLIGKAKHADMQTETYEEDSLDEKVISKGQPPRMKSKQSKSQIEDLGMRKEIGKKAQALLNKQTISQLDILDSNVIYQQNGDQTKGVLYFKNFESLQDFLLKRTNKRPVYSKKRDKVVHQHDDNQRQSEKEVHLSKVLVDQGKQLRADIDKKRQFLHNTLSNFIPKGQLKQLQQVSRQKLNFQEAINAVTQDDNKTSSTKPHSKEPTRWVPIQNFKQYPFYDINTLEGGIVDLKIKEDLVSPSGYSRSLSRQDNVRSESSPGLTRNNLSRRLQTFYGITNNNSSFNGQRQQKIVDKSISIKGFEDVGGASNFIESKFHNEDRSLNNDIERSLLADREEGGLEVNSSQLTGNPRHIVFFKTSIRFKEDQKEGVLGYGTQNHFLHHRLDDLNEETDDRPSTKSSNYYTIGVNKKFLRSTDMIGEKALISSKIGASDVPTGSRVQSTAQIPLRNKASILKMSQGIERSKLRNLERFALHDRGPIASSELGVFNMPRSALQSSGAKHNVISNSKQGESQQSTAFPHTSLNTKKHKLLYNSRNAATSLPQHNVGMYNTQSETRPTGSSFFTLLSKNNKQAAEDTSNQSQNLAHGSLVGAQEDSRNGDTYLRKRPSLITDEAKMQNNTIRLLNPPTNTDTKVNIREIIARKACINRGGSNYAIYNSSLKGLMRIQNTTTTTSMKEGNDSVKMDLNISHNKLNQ